MMPDQVHFGQAEQVYDARQKILDYAFEANPERFVKMPPKPPRKPIIAWINPAISTRRNPSLDQIPKPAVSKSLTRSEAYANGREARAGIGSWMTSYNEERPHQATDNRMPMAVWRADMEKIEALERTVDMPLRLDNANALPTYPQRQKQQTEAA